jgi:hypothetical protein
MPGGASPVRDSRLSQFASSGASDAPVPSARLALLADEVSGPERRCPGANGDELIGLLRTWASIESWAAAAKLGVITELIRREDAPRSGGYHGDLPDEWSASLRHELAAALACSTQSAEATTWLAWEQQARLRAVGTLLADGTLTFAKARAVVDTFKYLTDGDAAQAEALIVEQLAGKTYTQVLRLAEQAALSVDPALAARRREQAQRKDARVAFFREMSGTAGLSGRDLPPDEALAAMASVHARAAEYQESGAFGDTRMDVLRAYAYLDLLNGVPAGARIACAEAQDEAAEAAEALAWAKSRAGREPDRAGTGCGAGGGPEAEVGSEAEAEAEGESEPKAGDEPKPKPGTGCEPEAGASAGSGTDDRDDDTHDVDRFHNADDDDQPDDSGDSDDGGRPDRGGDGGGLDPDVPRPGGFGAGPCTPWSGRALQLRPPDLGVPLSTLLGLAERPRRDPGLRPARPGAGPGIGRCRDRQPAHRGLRDRHQLRGLRHRPRLRSP